MTDADKPAFAAAIAELKALKPGPALTDLQFEAWWNALRGKWSLADFRSACALLRDSVEFMPNPFHFEELRRTRFGTSGEMWALALAHAGSLSTSGGFLQEVPSGNALLDAAARAIGGYRKIASAGCESLHFIERRFCEHLESIRDAEAVRTALPEVTGGPRLIENATRGLQLLGKL